MENKITTNHHRLLHTLSRGPENISVKSSATMSPELEKSKILLMPLESQTFICLSPLNFLSQSVLRSTYTESPHDNEYSR